MDRDAYQAMFEAEQSHWWYVGMRAICDGLLGELLPPSPSILDVGCGTGGNLAHLGTHARVVGIDRSNEAAYFCRIRGVPMIQANAEALPFADAGFDCVISLDVLYHLGVKSDRAAMEEMARVVRPGGWVLLRLPAWESLRRRHDRTVHTRHRYLRSEVGRLLRDANLEVVRLTYANSLLLPLLALRAGLERFGNLRSSELDPLPAWLDRTFRACLMGEARLLRHVSLPIGASVIALGRKPSGS